MGETVNTLEERNESQKKTIHKLSNELVALKQRQKELEVWERFVGYLLDNCETQPITEESLQKWLSDLLESEKKTQK